MDPFKGTAIDPFKEYRNTYEAPGNRETLQLRSQILEPEAGLSGPIIPKGPKYCYP